MAVTWPRRSIERGEVMEAVREGDVTRVVARFLGSVGAKVESIAYPGGGSGTVLQSDSRPDGKNRNSVVPDIIARLADGAWILVESKPLVDLGDAHKLAGVRSGDFDQSVQRVLGVPSASLVTALAFSGNLASQAERIHGASDLVDIGFHVSADGSVQIVWNHHSSNLEGVGGAHA